MERSNSALQKEISHNYHDIKKAHTLAERLATQAGSSRDELRRAKTRA